VLATFVAVGSALDVDALGLDANLLVATVGFGLDCNVRLANSTRGRPRDGVAARSVSGCVLGTSTLVKHASLYFGRGKRSKALLTGFEDRARKVVEMNGLVLETAERVILTQESNWF
jgi:hypothetical protein